MRVARRFTREGQSPYAGIQFDQRVSEIKNPDGSLIELDPRVRALAFSGEPPGDSHELLLKDNWPKHDLARDTDTV